MRIKRIVVLAVAAGTAASLALGGCSSGAPAKPAGTATSASPTAPANSSGSAGPSASPSEAPCHVPSLRIKKGFASGDSLRAAETAEAISRKLNLAASACAEVIREEINFAEVAEAGLDPGTWAWDNFDTIANQIQSHGDQFHPVLMETPAQAAADKACLKLKKVNTKACIPTAKSYSQFAYQTVMRYGDRNNGQFLEAVECGNEWNLNKAFVPHADPRKAGPILAACYNGAHAAARKLGIKITVNPAGLAQAKPNDGIDPVAFYRELKATGYGRYMDNTSIHYYGDVTRLATAVMQIHDVFPDKGVRVTEFGATTAGHDYTISIGELGKYIAEALATLRGLAYVLEADCYTIQDRPGDGSEDHFGLFDEAGHPKGDGVNAFRAG